MHLIWVDVETTGLGDDSHLLELAMVVTDSKLVEKDRFAQLIETPNDVLEKAWSPHKESGLVEDVRRHGLPISTVEDNAIYFMWPWMLSKKFGGGDSSKATMAGLSVHYDYGVLRRTMPRLAGMFSHRLLDVRAVERYARLIGCEGNFVDLHGDPKHRAIDDCFRAMQEIDFWHGKIGDRLWEARTEVGLPLSLKQSTVVDSVSKTNSVSNVGKSSEVDDIAGALTDV